MLTFIFSELPSGSSICTLHEFNLPDIIIWQMFSKPSSSPTNFPHLKTATPMVSTWLSAVIGVSPATYELSLLIWFEEASYECEEEIFTFPKVATGWLHVSKSEFKKSINGTEVV